MKHRIVIFLLLAALLVSCGNPTPPPTIQPATVLPAASTPTTPTISSSITPNPSLTPTASAAARELTRYAFPTSIDPTNRYLFYLHGKIIEDQGLPAISPDFGEYKYLAILQRLSETGHVVISEARSKDTDGYTYAKKIANQVQDLLHAGVLPQNITVVGASKGGGITIYVSHLLENSELNFVIMAICNPDKITSFKQEQINLYGNVLSIYDSADDLAGSCQDLFTYSEGKGLSRHEEIVLDIGTGHGILYQPLDAWITPILQWAGDL
jgi:hypothetical protein